LKIEIFPRIEVDPKIQGGFPVVKGSRVPVGIVLRYLAKGMSMEEVAQEFGITMEDVQAVLAFAASRLEKERPLSAA